LWPQLAFSLGTLFGQYMTSEGLLVFKTISCPLETLGSASVGLNFRHDNIPLSKR